VPSNYPRVRKISVELGRFHWIHWTAGMNCIGRHRWQHASYELGNNCKGNLVLDLHWHLKPKFKWSCCRSNITTTINDKWLRTSVSFHRDQQFRTRETEAKYSILFGSTHCIMHNIPCWGPNSRSAGKDVQVFMESKTYYNIHIKSKAIPVIGRGGLYGCKMSRITHCVDNRLIDGGKVVSPTPWGKWL
jgi:hypothetical protein